jgi:hypothetical protein
MGPRLLIDEGRVPLVLHQGLDDLGQAERPACRLDAVVEEQVALANTGQRARHAELTRACQPDAEDEEAA